MRLPQDELNQIPFAVIPDSVETQSQQIDTALKVPTAEQTIGDGNYLEPEIGFAELAGAYALRSASYIPNYLIKTTYDKLTDYPEFQDENYDATKLPYYNDPDYELIKNDLLGARNYDQAEIIKSQFDQELIFKRDSERAGILKNLGASVIGGLADPFTWLTAPLALPGRTGTGFYNILKTAGAGVAYNMLGAAPEALIRTSEEKLYTTGNAALDISAAGILGGLFAGAGKSLSDIQVHRGIKKMEKYLTVDDKAEGEIISKENFENLVKEIKDTFTPEEAKSTVKALSQTGVGRAVLSDSPGVSEYAKRLMDWNSAAGNPAVEVRALRKEAELVVKKNLIIMDEYRNWQKHMNNDTLLRKGLKALDLDSQYNQFLEEVGIAMHSGDRSPNPVSQRTAQRLRSQVSNPIADRLVETKLIDLGAEDIFQVNQTLKPLQGELSQLRKSYKGLSKEEKVSSKAEFKAKEKELLSQIEQLKAQVEEIKSKKYTYKDLKTQFDESYLHKVYNTKKIRENLPEFKAFLKKKFSEERINRGEVLDAKALKKIDTAAEETAKKLAAIPGNTINSVDYHRLGKPGVTRSRTLSIPASEMKEWLILNVDDMLTNEIRSVIPAAELMQEFGSASFEGSRLALKKQFDDYLFNTKLSPQQRTKKIKKFENDLLDLETAWNRIRHIVSISKDKNLINNEAVLTALRTGRNIVHTNKSGKFWLASMLDMVNQVLYFGLTRTFGTQLKLFGKYIANKSAYKMEKRMLQDFGLACNSVTKMGQNIYNDLAYGLNQNKAEQWTRWSANLPFKFNLMDQVDEWLSMGTNYMMMQDISRLVRSAKPNKQKAQFYFDMGLDPKDYAKVKQMLDLHESSGEGLKFANLQNWEPDLAIKMANIFKKAETTMTPMPGASTLPRFADNPAFSICFTFKRFMLSCTQKILIPILQGRVSKANVATAFVVGWGYGMMKEYINDLYNGKPIKEVDHYVKAGLKHFDPWGIVGWSAQAVDQLVGISGNAYGKSLFDVLLGPIAGVGEDLFKTLGNSVKTVRDGHVWSNSDRAAFKRLIPLNDLFGISQTLDAALGIDWSQEGGIKSSNPGKRIKDE